MSNPTILPRPLTVRVVLIHHRVPERVEAAEETVRLVARAFEGVGPVDVAQVSWQPDPSSAVSTWDLARRRVRQWRLERRWAGYLGVGPRWILSSGLLGLRLLQLLGPTARERAGRQGFIELALTAKHEFAWRAAIEDDIDVLVVLEDDARGHVDSGSQIRHAIEIVARGASLLDCYIDLAGGISPAALRTSRIEHIDGHQVVRLSKPATNTTCAYVAGRDVLQVFAEALMREPGLRRLPADWLMNRCFLQASPGDRGSDARCFHTRPPALTHGSVAGTVDSSIRQ